MRTIVVDTPFGTFRVPDTSGYVVTALKRGKLDQEDVVDTILRYFQPDKAFADVGTFVGVMIIYLAQKFPEASFYAFEANPEIYELLEDNLQRNKVKNVFPRHVALYDGTRHKIRFPKPEITRKLHGYGMFGVDPDATDGWEVEAVSLDEVLADIPVGFVKIDAQGADLAVMRGGRGMIAKQAPLILFEYANTPTAVRFGKAYCPFDEPLSDYYRFVDEIGYEVVWDSGMINRDYLIRKRVALPVL